MAKNSADPVETLISVVATRSEHKFIKDPEPGEMKPAFNLMRRQAAAEYVRCIVTSGERPQLNTKMNGIDFSLLSEKRRGQIITRLASAWLEHEDRIKGTPSFVTAKWFRGYLHTQLIAREAAKPRQESKRYKMS